jgi:hypothetical protein
MVHGDFFNGEHRQINGENGTLQRPDFIRLLAKFAPLIIH